MKLYLIRHGETDGNRNRIVQTPDTPLSQMGEQQAKCLAKAYQKANIAHVVSSDYSRALVTAQYLHQALSQNPSIRLNKQITKSTLLRERSFGDLRGKAYDDIDLHFLGEDSNPPNGETQTQFIARVAQAWDFIINLSQETTGDLALLTHGLFIRYLLTDVLKLLPKSLEQHDIRNTCVTTLNVSDLRNIHVDALFDASHLAHLDESSEMSEGRLSSKGHGAV